MGTIMGAIISVLLLIVAVWIAVFGGVGALFARSRGGSAPMGLAWGAALGPIGWLAIAWFTRERGSAGDRVAAEPSQLPPASYGAPQPNDPSGGSAEQRWDPWNQ